MSTYIHLICGVVSFFFGLTIALYHVNATPRTLADVLVASPGLVLLACLRVVSADHTAPASEYGANMFSGIQEDWYVSFLISHLSEGPTKQSRP